MCALPLTRPLPSSSAPDVLRWRGCPLCCCVCVYYGPSRAAARVVRRPCWQVDHPMLCEPPSLKLCVRELSSCRRRSTLRSTSHIAGLRACSGRLYFFRNGPNLLGRGALAAGESVAILPSTRCRRLLVTKRNAGTLAEVGPWTYSFDHQSAMRESLDKRSSTGASYIARPCRHERGEARHRR